MVRDVCQETGNEDNQLEDNSIERLLDLEEVGWEGLACCW